MAKRNTPKPKPKKEAEPKNEVVKASGEGAEKETVKDMLFHLFGITFVTKGASALVRTIENEFGLLTAPFHTKRMEWAKAQKPLYKKMVDHQIEDLEWEQEEKRHERALARDWYAEERRQFNLEQIALEAVKVVPDEVSDKPVDPDWVFFFKDCAQDVGDPEMQYIWGKILAGEVANPGSYSLRTLQAVRLLSKQEADVFTRFCTCVWTLNLPYGRLTPIIPRHNVYKLVEGVNLSEDELTLLDSTGLILIQPIGAGVDFSYSGLGDYVGNGPFNYQMHCKYFDRDYTFFRTETTYKSSIKLDTGHAILTEIGKQLSRICGASYNQKIEKICLEHFESMGWHLPRVS